MKKINQGYGGCIICTWDRSEWSSELRILIWFRLNLRKFKSRKTHFWTVFRSQLLSAVSSTHQISIKNFQIHHRMCLEYSRNFRGLPTHGFAHAKSKKSIFNWKILEFIGDIGTILNDFLSWFHTSVKIWVKFIWL